MTEYKALLPEITLKYKTGSEKKVKINTSRDAYNLLKCFYDMDLLELTETFLVVFLNRSNNTLGWMRLSTGGIAGTVVDIKLIFATALKCAASGIILSHNHPSGNMLPSHEDERTTQKIKQAGLLFDISLLDHIIMGVEDGQFYSMADEGKV